MRYLFLLLPFIMACNNEPGKTSPPSTSPHAEAVSVPRPNTVVASDSMQIPDELNELYFSIEVIASAQSPDGIYEVLVSYGHNDASAQISMPEADVPIIPEVRRGEEPYTYIIGFHYGNDTAFRDYFKVKASRGRTEMKYLKAYSFK